MTACTIQCATYCCCSAFRAQHTAPHNTVCCLLLLFSVQSPTHCPAQHNVLLTPAVQRSEPDSLSHTIQCATYSCCSAFRALLTAPHNSALLTPAVQRSELYSLPHTIVRYLLLLFSVQSPTHCPAQ